jgi:hypothetical protein
MKSKARMDLRTELQGMTKGALIRRLTSLDVDDAILDRAAEGTKDDVIDLILSVEDDSPFGKLDLSGMEDLPPAADPIAKVHIEFCER